MGSPVLKLSPGSSALGMGLEVAPSFPWYESEGMGTNHRPVVIVSLFSPKHALGGEKAGLVGAGMAE